MSRTPYKRLLLTAWYARRTIWPFNCPFPWPLPYGGVFLVHPDEMGLSIFLPSVLRRRSYEEYSWQFVRRYVTRGMMCLDIGANQGFYTVLLARLVGKEGRVIAFEPVPEERKKLTRNITLNRCNKQTTIEAYAVNDRSGKVSFVICLSGRASRSGFSQPPEDVSVPTRRDDVQTISLDDFVRTRHLKRIDFIKIDAEGAEQFILRGAKNTLRSLHPVLMIEAADIATRQFGYQASLIIDLLTDQGYRLYSCAPQGDLIPLDRQGRFHENVIAVPCDRESTMTPFLRKDDRA